MLHDSNIQWRVLYTRTLELEAEGEFSEYEVEDSDDEVNEDGGETRVVFRSETVQRILMDFTQGEEPVITVIQVAVTPDVEPEPPAVVPYIQESSEADMVVHSTCA